MDTPESAITQQREEYRKGQVLGFTMAEIMLVLLFLLLLLLGDRIRGLNKELDQSIVTGSNQHQSLILLEQTRQGLQKKGLMPQSKDDLWLTKKLTLAADDIISEQGQWTDTAEETIEKLSEELVAAQQDLRQAREALATVAEDGESLRRGMELSETMASQGISLEKAQICLSSCGGGPDACWGESTSNPDFIYNIALFDDRIFVEPDETSVRKNSLAWQLLPAKARIETGSFFSETEFRAKFSELDAHGDANECVYQTRLFDADTSTKDIYKSKVRLVEGYVYPTPITRWRGSELELEN